MIKILVLDNNPNRHSNTREVISAIFDKVESLFYEQIDVDDIPIISPDILIVHRNNPEFGLIAANSYLAKYRIFFSGSYSGSFKESDYEHYVKDSELHQALNEIKANIAT